MGFEMGMCPYCHSTKPEITHPTPGQNVLTCGNCGHTVVTGSVIERDQTGKQIKPKKETKRDGKK